MSIRSWRIDLRDDNPAAEAEAGTTRESGSRLLVGAEEGSAEAPRGLGAVRSRLRRGWDSVVGIGRVVCGGAFGGRLRFEESLHQFAKELNEAGNPGEIEASLLRLTQDLVPRGRIELSRRHDDLADRGAGGSAGNPAADSVGPPVRVRGRRICESIAEVPLRCGGAIHGRLQILATRKDRLSVRPEALRRLAIVCTMAACALENLRQQAEWEWKGGDEANGDGPARSNETNPAGVIGDATFLNAVFPFALGQARRHREPLSLLFLAIDRLGAIQDLLGPEAADHLIQEVCRVVASSIRSSDIVARLDDDRIVVLLIRARARNAHHVAQMISQSVAEKTRNVAELGCATVSIGVAEFPRDARNTFLLLDAADDALARAQDGGRNQVALAEARPTPDSTSPDAIPSVSCLY